MERFYDLAFQRASIVLKELCSFYIRDKYMKILLPGVIFRQKKYFKILLLTHWLTIISGN